MNEIRYFTFPVLFLPDCFEDLQGACNQMIEYSIYAHSLKLKEGEQLDRIKSSANYHNVSLGNAKRTLDKWNELFYSLPDKLPTTSLNTQTVFQFRDEYKTEFEIDCFVAFAAIKSVLGKREYLKMNDSALLARMSGLSGLSIPPEEIPERLQKYRKKRYHREKLLNELTENWNLTTYARFVKGYYVSISMDYETLGFEIENARIIKKENQSKKEANARILARLKPP